MIKPLPDDCTVRLIDLPISVGGRISEGPDGHIDIYINARLSRDGQRRAWDHELDHLENDDLHNGLDIRAVEGRHARKLPPLIRARDLLPKSKPRTAPAAILRPAKPAPARISPRQASLLLRAIADLDAVSGFNIP